MRNNHADSRSLSVGDFIRPVSDVGDRGDIQFMVDTRGNEWKFSKVPVGYGTLRFPSDSIPLYVRATPEQLVAAAKAYAEDVDNDYEVPSNEARQYVPGAHVWLNQSRHSEWINEEEEAKIRIVK